MKFSSVQLLSHVWLFVTPWTAACQASLCIADSQNLLKLSPLSQWCLPTISSSVVPFSSLFWSFPASGSFQMSQFFASGGQSIGVSPKRQWRHNEDFFFFHMMKTFSLIIFSIVFLSVLAKNSVLKVIIDCLEMSPSLERKNNDNDGN